MKHKIIFTCIFLAVAFSSQADVTFSASAPKTVAVGQQFRLSYYLNDKGKDIRVPEISDFEIKFGPEVSRGQSVQIIGTQVETTINETYTYILQAKEEGDFEIGPATITVDNKQYRSNSLSIKVVAADKANQISSSRQGQLPEEQTKSVQIDNSDIFIRAHVSKNSVYENEGFLITYKMYFRIQLETYSMPAPSFANFMAYELESSGNTPMNTENVNGKMYTSFVLKQFVLYPQKSGKLTIPSEKSDITARFLVRRARSFFDNDQYTQVNKTIHSSAVTIDVKPLPSGKPASFAGAAGDYKMTSSITSENVKTNEGITIKLNISGSGNIKLVKNPEFTFPNDFEIYDPKVDLNTKVSQTGVTGSKSIEYLIIPRFAGDFTIPAVEFSYFDLKTGSYKSLSTPEYKLHVEKGKDGDQPSQAVVNYSNKEDLRYLGKDIRYIKTDDAHFNPKGDYLFGTLTYFLLYLIPAVLFAIFFINYRKQAKENANLALVRTKKANKVASKRLKVAGKLLSENKEEEFYNEILSALWGYLSDKLNIPLSSLSKDNVETELSKYGAEEITIKDLIGLLNACEFARYASSGGTVEMGKVYNDTLQAINKMENTIKK